MYHMFWEQDFRDCPDCREFVEYSKTNHPFDSEKVRLVKLLHLLFFTIGTLLVAGGANSLSTLDQLSSAQSALFGGMIAGGVICLISSLPVGIWFFWGPYKEHNLVGYKAYAMLTGDGGAHMHLTAANKDPGNLKVKVRIWIVSGRWECKLVECSDLAEKNYRAFVDNGHLTLENFNTSLTTRSPKVFLQLLADGRGFEEISSRTLAAHRHLLTQMEAIELITGKNDPLEHGRSKHGQALHELAEAALKLAKRDVVSHSAESARNIVDKLVAAKKRAEEEAEVAARDSAHI